MMSVSDPAATAPEKVTPSNIEAEEALLGSILINPDALFDVATFLKADDFFLVKNGWIWDAILAIHDRRDPIDFVTVTDELERQERIQELGGPVYISRLMDAVPSAIHAEAYGRIVEQTALRRRLLGAASQVAQLAYNERENIEIVLDQAEQALFAVSERRLTRDLKPIRDIVGNYYDHIQELSERDEALLGVPTGFSFLDKLLGGLQKSDLIIIAGRPGMGKCVTGDTRLVNPNSGELTSIEEMVKQKQGDLLTLEQDFKLRPARASHFLDDGDKPAFQVRTALGREIKVTLTHPFLTINGWRPLGKLQIGDHIAVPRTIPCFGKDNPPDHQVRALALLIADGCLTRNTPRFTNSNPKLRKDFQNAAEAFPGVRVRQGDDHNGRTPTLYVTANPAFIQAGRKHFAHELQDALKKSPKPQSQLARHLGVAPSSISHWKAGICVPAEHTFEQLCDSLDISSEKLAPVGIDTIRRTSPNNLTQWLQEQEIWGKTALEKDIPSSVFRYNRSKLSLFLNRLFAGDGSIHVQNKTQPVVSYSTSSLKLARSVQHLLLRFGIIVKLRHRQSKYKQGYRPSYQLRITESTSIQTFIDEIGALGKEQAIEHVRAILQESKSNPNRDTIPLDVWIQIKKAKGDKSWRSVNKAMGLPADTNIHVNSQAPSREKLLAIGGALQDPSLVNLAQSDVYWDQIVEITPLGKQRVYDLTVPETHNFVADDVIVHNTGFLLNIALNAAKRYRKRAAIFSLEMSDEQLVGRLVAAETGIDSQRLRRGALAENEWALFTKATGQLAETLIFIDDTPSITPLQLRTKCRRLYAEYGLDLIVLDYLQLMSGDFRTDNRVQEISYISRHLKGLARELNVPVVAAAQLSRAVEQRPNKRPMLSDLRESGSIEQDADIVMFIYRDDYYNEESEKPNIAEIAVAKHRNGPTDTIELFFKKELAQFRELERRQFNQ